MKLNLKSITIGLLSLFFIGLLAIFFHYYKYRFESFAIIGTKQNIVIKDTEVYTNKLSYSIADSVVVYVKSNLDGKAYIKKINFDLSHQTVDSFSFEANQQDINYSQSAKGCNWKRTNSFLINSNYLPGYYFLELTTNTTKTKHHFIVKNEKTSKVAVLAPVSTWVAYNNWGGQSLYHNNIDKVTPYYVSSTRPNPNNDIRVESHSTNYFLDNYDAMLFPDYTLETDFETLKNVDVIVLNYHAEYFTDLMYDKLNSLVQDNGISLISLGGNQMYWRTKWNKDFTIMECRKDMTSFSSNIFDYGGMWRHHLGKSEHNLLGNRFTDAGMHSYAPYEIQNDEHWIFDNIDVKNGDLFGYSGIDSLPLSGDETDKMVQNDSKITLLAKGVNCSNKNPFNQYDDNCIGNEGADFIIKEESNYSVLSTGSIQSGSGIGIDSVFTSIIDNFIDKQIR